VVETPKKKKIRFYENRYINL